MNSNVEVLITFPYCAPASSKAIRSMLSIPLTWFAAPLILGSGCLRVDRNGKNQSEHNVNGKFSKMRVNCQWEIHKLSLPGDLPNNTSTRMYLLLFQTLEVIQYSNLRTYCSVKDKEQYWWISLYGHQISFKLAMIRSRSCGHSSDQSFTCFLDDNTKYSRSTSVSCQYSVNKYVTLTSLLPSATLKYGNFRQFCFLLVQKTTSRSCRLECVPVGRF